MAASTSTSLTITGVFSPAEATNLSKYYFEIVQGGTGAGTVTYKWKRFGEAFSSTVAIHSGAVSFEAGLLAAWDVATTYTSGDEWLIQARPNETFKARSLGWLEDGEKRDLLGYDESSGDLNIIKDFYGTKEVMVAGNINSLPSDVTIIKANSSFISSHFPIFIVRLRSGSVTLFNSAISFFKSSWESFNSSQSGPLL